MTALSRLSLTDFRNHADALLGLAPGFVMLSGDNGAGKTNILEAVSMLAPGRGLRRAALRDMARQAGPGGFSVAARLEDGTELGTGTLAAAPDRRQLRVNGANAPLSQLAERLAILWLTPAMDRLFADSKAARRAFLDRLTLALEPGHGHHASRYEAAMRARNKLLAEPESADPDWLSSLEAGMAEHGEALHAARERTVASLSEAVAGAPVGNFPKAGLVLTGYDGGDLRQQLRTSRTRDGQAGRTLVGPHRQDLEVSHLEKNQPASLSSTGEQKALLLGLVLAHGELVETRRGMAPILLLDEVAAHLDPGRREALYERLEGRGQVWMTGTEAALFDGVEGTRFHVADGRVEAN
ncbi:DNA replication/repair protein RecF [Sphingomicrobium nitratireducens]|uniref:DNA replication/repair protein RecF n=1 Tax=Sphingomicrobium nitratireducens TaxID=2964666 RepID=UPI002240863D|nr:DNA replication/repair protein RecF [Sphingomicrobium nitratireducens]